MRSIAESASAIISFSMEGLVDDAIARQFVTPQQAMLEALHTPDAETAPQIAARLTSASA